MRRMSYTLWTILWMIPFALWSQHKWEGAIFIGGANYQGDLVPTIYPYPAETNLSAGIALRYAFNPQWGLRFSGMYGQLSGTDQNFSDPNFFKKRQFQFESQVIESSIVLEWEPFGKRRYPGFNQFKKIWSPYLFAGGGFALVNAQPVFTLYQNGETPPAIRADQAVKYPQHNFAVPIGGGLRIDVSRRLALGLEGGTRYAFSDYLDGISQSANPLKGDWYTFAGATLSLRFFKRDEDGDGIPDKEDRCPKQFGHPTARGCPDRDGDGVEDSEDICPDEPGIKILAGCPDSDNDGIPDYEDACPFAAGPEKLQGCPDSDGDGIADREDWCPRLPGLTWKGGCPLLDTNGDGIIDELHFCIIPPDVQFLERARQQVAVQATILRFSQVYVLNPSINIWKPNFYKQQILH